MFSQVIFRSFKDYLHFIEKFFLLPFSQLGRNSIAILFQRINDLLMGWVSFGSSVRPHDLLVASVDPEHFDLRGLLPGWDRFDFNVWIRLNDRLLEVVCWSSESSSSTILNDDFAHFRKTIKKFIKEHILFLLIKFIYETQTIFSFKLKYFIFVKVLELS